MAIETFFSVLHLHFVAISTDLGPRLQPGSRLGAWKGRVSTQMSVEHLPAFPGWPATITPRSCLITVGANRHYKSSRSLTPLRN
jgi:hypothetical protein